MHGGFEKEERVPKIIDIRIQMQRSTKLRNSKKNPDTHSVHPTLK